MIKKIKFQTSIIQIINKKIKKNRLIAKKAWWKIKIMVMNDEDKQKKWRNKRQWQENSNKNDPINNDMVRSQTNVYNL